MWELSVPSVYKCDANQSMRNGKQLMLGWLDSTLGNILRDEQIETLPKHNNLSKTTTSGVLSMFGCVFDS